MCSDTKKISLAIFKSNYFSFFHIHLEPLLNSELSSFQAIYILLIYWIGFFKGVLNYGALLQKLSNKIFFFILLKGKHFLTSSNS